MSHRSSWDLKEVYDRSIPQLGQGSKRPWGAKVCLFRVCPGEGFMRAFDLGVAVELPASRHWIIEKK